MHHLIFLRCVCCCTALLTVVAHNCTLTGNVGQRQSGQGTLYTLYIAVDHHWAQCPLACLEPPSSAVAAIAQPSSTRRKSRPNICVSWNKGSCLFPGDCTYKHEYITCQSPNHRAKDCPRTPDTPVCRRSPQQRPPAHTPPSSTPRPDYAWVCDFVIVSLVKLMVVSVHVFLPMFHNHLGLLQLGSLPMICHYGSFIVSLVCCFGLLCQFSP